MAAGFLTVASGVINILSGINTVKTTLDLSQEIFGPQHIGPDFDKNLYKMLDY